MMKSIIKRILGLAVLFIYSSVYGSYLFYDNAEFATDDSGLNFLAAGETVSGDNFSKNDDRIKGIYFNAIGVNYNDINFRQGNSNDPSTWTNAAPVQVAGDEGAYFLRWDTGIKNSWLQISYGGNLLYIGNLVGDTNKDGVVTASDALLIINHINQAGYDSQTEVGINENLDINKDNHISPIDAAIVLNVLGEASSLEGTFIENESTGKLQYYDGTQYILFNTDLIPQSIAQPLSLYTLQTSPIPEPSTIFLLGIGFIVLAWVFRKKESKMD